MPSSSQVGRGRLRTASNPFDTFCPRPVAKAVMPSSR